MFFPKKCVFLVLLFALVFSSCKDDSEKTRPVMEPITEAVYASGTIKSVEQYQVFASASGIIRDIRIQEGDSLKKGDILFVLSNETARLSTENARIAAEYADVSNQADKLRELQATIDLARIKLRNDSSLLERQKKLWADGIGTRYELEQRELAASNSATALDIAIRRLSDTRKQIDFAARQARKNLQISSSTQSDFTVRSEINGKVFSVFKEKGEMVSPQTPLAELGSASDFYLELQVDEYDIVKVKPGQKIVISLDSHKGEVFEGEVRKINPIMDERSRTFTVEAVFTRPPAILYPNLSAETNIVISTRNNAVTIPRAYLLKGDEVLLENGSRKKVSVGLKDYQKAEILVGLDTNDVILKPVK